MTEEWRPVPSQPLLQASSLGRIRSLPYETPMPHGGTKVNQMQPTYGVASRAQKSPLHRRWQVTFQRRSLRVARLVCEAFHGPAPPDKPYALHSDENGANNVPGNLYWGTQKENLNAPGFIAYAHSGGPGNRTYIDPTQGYENGRRNQD